MSDPYKVLGITRDASDDEVKKAYRNMSRKYHPDANINNPNKDKAEEMFKLVQQAYQQIMKERSGDYSSSDPSGRYGSGYGGFGGFGDFSDFGFGGFNNQRAAGEDDEDAIHLRAAVNYIQGRHFREALNVLDTIRNRSAMWYYYSAVANNGVGNNATALQHAQTALNMEPGNRNYQELVQILSSGGSWYMQKSSSYGYPFGGSVDCSRLCMTMILCNVCCGGGGCFVPFFCI
ncbi:J domain-containing protein [Butyrivibrio fibrisolvens]|uniref:J domain-containing protein n=1 Tax=Butyrivibrio fibrisolvens TaxID=831 RepID=UPI0020BDD983|nr:DnaJ domain-containing protein [Butyrivibrio fibrisolvens]